jgi:hypothetical protein
LTCAPQAWGSRAFRIACRYFCLEEYRLVAHAQAPLPAKRSFRVISVLDKSVILKYAAGEQEIVKGQSVLLPAALADVAACAGDGAHFLLSSVPDLRTEVVQPLAAEGFSSDDIVLLGGDPRTNDLLPLL